MCTIVAIHGVHPEASLIVAANRDELYARAALPPSVLEPGIVGGRDLVAKGTWLGLTPRGLFVAVTNQRTMRPPDPARHSRGELVLQALRSPNVDAIASLLNALDGRRYNPFNLLFGDGERLFVAYAREQSELAVSELQPGVIVLANDRIGAEDYPKTQRAEQLLNVQLPLDALLDDLPRVLGDHEKPPLDRVPPPPAGSMFSHELLQKLQALCIHAAFYGTRSSSIVALSKGTVHAYRHAEGTPCTHAFVDYAGLLRG